MVISPFLNEYLKDNPLKKQGKNSPYWYDLSNKMDFHLYPAEDYVKILFQRNSQ